MLTNDAGQQTSVVSRLEAARRDLLDLGLRNNTLLNYKLLKSRGVDVVDESPTEVFRLLVRDGRTLVFQPAPEQTQLMLDVVPPPSADEVAARLTDRKLQTSLPEAQLQSRLLKTYYAARTHIEEQGVNVLYLALGMLEWYEADASQERRRAPLLLVPVLLERSDARDRFHLTWSGEDIGDNLSLAAMLAANFGITVPPLSELEDLDIDAYFAAFADAVAQRPRWSVDRNAVALGFFSFGKFLMYRDLDASTWPPEARPDAHPIIRALLQDGFHDGPSPLGDDDFVDRVVRPGELHEVVDADSSQTLAILDARAGRDLVIQGPPGTGKSQTITNLIAESIASGKKVLFVAEKLAALEVVKRRLDEIGLGDACLELHSHKINKRTVLAELQRTIELGRPRVGDGETGLAQLVDARDRLNAYCEAINQPVGASGVTPYHALGELVRIGQEPASGGWPRLEIPGVAEWSVTDAARREGIVDELQARLARMGVPETHPFWGVGLRVVLPTDETRLRDLLDDAIEAEASLGAAGVVLANMLGLPAPTNREEAEELGFSARLVLVSPDLADVDIASSLWIESRQELQTLLDVGRTRAVIHARRSKDVIPEAWSIDLLPIRRDLAAYQDRWWRIFSGTYRRAKGTLAGYSTGVLPQAVDEQLALVDDILAVQRADATIETMAGLGASRFRSLWLGPTSDWPRLTMLTEWITSIHDDEQAGRLPPGTVNVVALRQDRVGVQVAVDGLGEALLRRAAALEALVLALAFNSATYFRSEVTIADRSFADVTTLMSSWSTSFQRLREMTAFNVSSDLCRQEGMAQVVDVAASWWDAGRCLTALMWRARSSAVLDRVFRERRELAIFDGNSHSQVVEHFRRLDVLRINYNRAALALQHWNSLPRGNGSGQVAVLSREFKKRSRHMPVRQLMIRAGSAIQAIKPVFMMSPLSIATYLPSGSVTFDIVVFDEASQVRPVDAFGALIRGRQAIVVGDDKQLPPTSFFDRITQDDGGDEYDEEVETKAFGSILELFEGQQAPKRMLRWHYRSKHESLIAVSNQEFYKNRLVVFPSPDSARGAAGLIFHHLPDTAYDRGGSRTNRDEAAIVAKEVMAHAHAHQDFTLGVASFSGAQTQAIIDELENLRRADPSAETFFSAHPTEPFFVKNLENVQGDERDVIFISVGYGKSTEGSLTMNFGPLNAKGGERRLNVLITRAKLRCEVFTNLTDDDIDPDSNTPGVVALKRFLRYARTGILDVPTASGRDADSPFEEAVEAALVRAGYTVQRQVGSAGFFIDLAIVDPERPGRYLLGIECDGATYHSARSARDRDRGRQMVLERLGWRIHRIWSVDWFRNPDEELRRVAAAIEAARAGGSVAIATGASGATTIERSAAPAAVATPALQPYVVSRLRVNTHGQELHAVYAATLAGWVINVVNVESPVHADEVIRRVTSAAGAGRTGSRIHSAISYAIALAAAQGKLVIRDGFLWSASMTTPPLRDRAALDGPGRDLAMVAPQEIELAIAQVVRDSYGIDPAQVAPAVARLFGFQRLTESMRAEIDPLVQDMLADGRLVAQSGQLRVAVSS